MRFKNGYFGACLVVLTLLTTVLAGYTLSIERDEIPVKGYDYVTDISGLFTYTDAPEYIEYNPSTNYTGYSSDWVDWPGHAQYTESPTVNQYRCIQTPGTTTTVSDTLTYTDTFTEHYDGEPSTTGAYSYRVGNWTGTAYNFGTAGTVSIPPATYDGANLVIDNIDNNYNPKANMLKLSTVLNQWIADNGLDSYATMSIDLTYGTAPVLFYAGAWDWTISYVGVPAVQVNTKIATLDESNSLPDHLDVSISSMTVSASRNGVELFNTNADAVAVIYDYEWNNTGTMAQANASVTAQITATAYPTYGYMDPTKGVSLVPDDDNPYSNKRGAVNWTNGYKNDTVTLKILKTDTSVLYIAPNGQTPNTYMPNYEVIAISSYATGFQLHYYDTAHRYIALGEWPAVQVTLYGSTGQIAVTPTTDVNLMSTVEENANTYYIDDAFSIADIENIIFMSNIVAIGYNAPNWQITNTTVFLNTYNAVLNNPSIEVSDYFDFDDWRLNFYSFAIYGDTMTVNGQTMTVDRINGTVTFTDVLGVQRTAKLNNLYITNEEVNGADHILLTFVHIGQYDLGETVDETVSFGGLWYFTSGIYKGYDTVQSVYNWDLDGGFHANAGECLVIFLGIIGAGVIVGRRFAGVNIGVLDWVIIGFAVFGALVYFGGLI